MNKLLGIIIFLLASSFSNAASLSEISAFAKDICDDIRTEGKISKKEISAKLQGEIEGIAKLFGVSVSSDGKLKLNEEEYIGLPYESLPEQMSNSRECKKDISKMLIKERQEISIITKPPKSYYGAFAQGTGDKVGWVTKVSSLSVAEDIAIERCGTFNCRVLYNVKGNECGSLMWGEGKYYIAKSPDRSSAENASLKSCQKHSSKCFSMPTVCARSKDFFDEFFD